MERSLEKYSIKMILIFTLLLGVLLWVNGPARTASAQVPPIPTPTPIVDSQTIEIVEGETVDLGDIPFQSTQVSGNIQTADGESVRYAEFQIYGASSNCSNEYSERTYGTTDEIGHFSMGGLPAGDYCLMLEADGGTGGLFGPLPVRFTIEEGGEALDLGTIAYREPNKIIQGVVLSESGEGVANVTVGASHRNQFYGWDNTTTDADGRFTLGVVGGAWDVSISPGNREESSGTTEQSWFSDNRHQIVAFAHSEIEETTDVEFQVQFTDATITGRIVAPDGTLLVDKIADDISHYGHAISVSAHNRSEYGKNSNVTVGDDGTFSIPVLSGNHEIYVYLDDDLYPNYYEPEALSIRVEPNDRVDLGDISVGKKTATIQGQALAPDGTGIARLPIFAASLDNWRDQGLVNTVTDEQGAYTMLVRAGDWNVYIQSSSIDTQSTGYFLLDSSEQTSVAENESVTVDFNTIGTAGNILGEIVDNDGLAITDLDVRVYARRMGDVDDGTPEDESLPEDEGLPGDRGKVVAQSMSEQGKFTLAVPSGVYEVGLYLPHNSGYVFANKVGTSVTDNAATDADERIVGASSRGQVAQANAVDVQRITVAPAGTAEDVTVQLVLFRNDATITGTLLDNNSEPVTGVNGEVYGWMDGQGGSHQSARIDPETGTYELSVAGGTWYLDFYVESDAYVNYGGVESLSVVVESNGSAQQDITLHTLDAIIRGTVTDPEGNPLRWGYVWADVAPSTADDPEEFFYHGAGTEIIDGEFELQVVSGLTYAVNANGARDHVQPAAQVVTPRADSPSVVDLQFRTTDGVISGTLTALIDDVVQPGMAGSVYGWSDDGQHANVEADEEGNFSFEVASGSIWYLGASWWPVGSEVFYNTEEDVTVDLTASTNGTAELTLTVQDFPMPPMLAEPFMVDEGVAYTLEDGTEMEIPAGAISIGNGTDAPNAPIAEAPALSELAPSVPSLPESSIPDDDTTASDEAEEASGEEAASDDGGAVQAQEARINVAPMVEDMPCTLTACPVGYGYNVTVYDTATGEQIIRNFNESVKMTFHYTDEELAEADEDSIAPAYFSSASNTWTRLDSFTLDTDANQIVAEISHPGRWALVTTANVEIRTPTALPTTDEEFKHQIFLPILMN